MPNGSFVIHPDKFSLRYRSIIGDGPMSDMLEVLSMMAVVVTFFAIVRYLNLRAARLAATTARFSEKHSN